MTEFMLPIVESGVEVSAIPGANGYALDTLGRAWSWWGKGRKVPGPWFQLKGTPNSDGYLHVMIGLKGNKRHAAIHHLMAELFIRMRERGEEVRHLNDVKTDNRLANLAIGTRDDNVADKVLNCRTTAGERSGSVVMSEQAVIEFRRRYAAGEPIAALARQAGVHWATMKQAVRGETWRHLASPGDERIIPQSERRVRLGEVQLEELRRRAAAGEKTTALAIEFGISYNGARDILKGRRRAAET